MRGRERKMTCKIGKWELSDGIDLAAALSNLKVQDNLWDGLPYPVVRLKKYGCNYILIDDWKRLKQCAKKQKI